jgi:sugar lactone lactonase YvrE
MAIHGDTLWVADIDVLRGFDRHSGAPLATIDFGPQHAVLLNDVAVGPKGELRVTDTGIIMSDKGVIHPGGDKVFLIGPNRAVSVLAQGNVLGRPNGITWDPKGRRWIVVSFDPFHSEVYTLNAGTDARTVLARGTGKLDGVEVLDDGRLLVTSWSDSSVHAFSGGRDERIIRGLINPADLGVDTRRNRVAVPLVTMGRVEFWQLPVE